MKTALLTSLFFGILLPPVCQPEYCSGNGGGAGTFFVFAIDE